MEELAYVNIALHLAQYKHLKASIGNEGRAEEVIHTTQVDILAILILAEDLPKRQELSAVNADKLAYFGMKDEQSESVSIDVPNCRAEVVHRNFAYSFSLN